MTHAHVAECVEHTFVSQKMICKCDLGAGPLQASASDSLVNRAVTFPRSKILPLAVPFL
jgi:hypothetical protein